MRNPVFTTIALSLLALFPANRLAAQITSPEVDKLVAGAMQKFDVAGIAVAIVKDGKVVHKKGYGVKSIETKSPVDEHTNFAIASNSKAFTTAALAILVEEGKLSWTDRVVTHIPEFRMYNDYVTANFNIQDLLTHRSGLGLGVGDLMGFPDGSDFTINDVVRSFQFFKPQSAFRTQFDYDNLLYWVAGEVIARASGMTWEAFIKTRIIEPLGMDNSFASIAEMKDRSNLASPHSTETGPMRAIPNFVEIINGAAGGIYSNVDDLCQWILLHLNKGKYGPKLEKSLFSEASQREMWSIHTTTEASRNPRYNAHFSGYGLGWGLTDVQGKMSVSHTGGLPGMLSKTLLLPDLNLGIVVLTNTSEGGGGAFSAISQTIMDSYLGLNDNGWIDRYFERYQNRLANADSVTTAVWETVKKADDSRINKADFVGIYQDNWFGKVEVFLKDGQLWFKSLRSPKLNGRMQFYKANAFAIKWAYQDMNADAFAIFSLDEEGRAQRITMKGISPNIDFSFDFQDLDLLRLKNEK